MWIFYALASRVLWSGCSATDQVLSRAHGADGARASVILQLCGFFPFVVIAGLLSGGLPLTGAAALIALFGMAVYCLAQAPYYMALQTEQAYNAVPYLEFTPVFLILIAYVMKHETLTPAQMAGAALVICSGFLFSWDFSRSEFKWRILALLASSSFLYALYQFSISAAGEMFSVWQVVFLFQAVQCLMGFALLAGLNPARDVIFSTVRATGGKTLVLALATNAFSFLGLVCLVRAFALAPTVGHVAALSGTQPVFSFLIALPLGVFLPRHFEKVSFSRETGFKSFLILLIFAGVYVLAS